MVKIFFGLVVFLGLVSTPVWYRQLPGHGGTGQPPELAKPVEGKQCIEPTTFMRANHMELLNTWRDDVVRNGKHVYVATDGARHDMSLTGTCLRCHADPAKFCVRCHEYSGVEAFCWDCHQQKRSGSL